MRGGRSSRLSPQAIAQVRSRAPQAKVTVVPDADHHITLDNPAGFVRAAREFLDTLD
jgi:pimeloyl-ACP methyl ester carboxylesterase